MNDSEVKYFHLSPDDKFLNYVIENCEKIAPNENLYIVRDSNGEPLRHVKDKRVKVLETLDELISELKKCKHVKKVFIHFLTQSAIPFTIQVPKHIQVYWVFWGADGYALPGMEHFLFNNKTKMFLKEAGIIKRETLSAHLKRKLIYLFGGKKAKLVKAIKRVDVCATWIKGDYQLIEKFNPRMKHLYYNNNSVEQLINNDNAFISKERSSFLNKILGKKYIIVGNSGDATNNHLEAFDIIKDMKDYDVVVPLSYGNKTYISCLSEESKSVLNDRFIPIYDFMEKKDYNLLLKNAQFLVMNHIRQQAANNILTALWYGVPVYMDSRSTLYQTFKDWGLSVGEIASLPHNLINTSMDENRRCLQHYLGDETISKAFKALLKE